MICINKNINSIPPSLRTDDISLAKNPAKTTHMYRNKLITNGEYPSVMSSYPYDTRYKRKDIKEELNRIYYGKCAYCERYDPISHIEHYRPKRGGYYWLAYSWDNLLNSCTKCNICKGNSFPIQNVKVEFENSPENIIAINGLSADYDLIESPLLINPERIHKDVLESIVFDKNGVMDSNDLRMRQTIFICKLNRRELCERRKTIWDELKDQIADCIYESSGNVTAESIALRVVLKNFKRRANDPKSEFLAFYNFILKSDWIKDEIRMLHS